MGCRGLLGWVVPVLGDNEVKSALASGRALRATKTCGLVVTLVSTYVTQPFIKELENVFELVVVKDMGHNNTQNDLDLVFDKIDIFQSALSMGVFSKLIVIRPLVILMRQSDYLFDSFGGENLLVMKDKCRRTFGIGMCPGLMRKWDSRLSGCCSESHISKEAWRTEIITSFGDIDWKHCSYEIAPEIITVSAIELEMFNQLSLPRTVGSHENVERNWVAVIGMSCRLPGANSPEEYWDILKNGRNTSGHLPESRLRLCSGIGSNTRGNFLKCHVDEFDTGFFGMSPSEATCTDPQARLLLEVSWEAFEDAYINPEKLRGSSTAVFHGSWLQDYKEALNEESDGVSRNHFMRKYIGNGFGCTAAKISYFYGFTGENVATESGCSSSMVAVNMACQSLLQRDCSLALATGSNVILQMDDNQKVLWAPDGKCKTFDVSANGYARAEGVAVLLLKRYSDALRDNDRIHGVILGGATLQEGLNTNFGAPTVDCETKVMKMALENSGVDPSEVAYLEAHATGTGVGDPIEAAAICNAYSSTIRKSERSQPLIIASGKTNIGHTESVSGLAAIIKVLLMFKHEMIPPHLNLSQMNPQINFDSIPGMLPLEITHWSACTQDDQTHPSRPRIAGVSSFGITGTYVHMLLQESPLQSQIPRNSIRNSQQDNVYPIPLEILTFSAKTTEALDHLERLYFDHITPENMFDVTFTANTSRSHNLGYRKVVILCPSTGKVIQKFSNDLKAGLGTKSKPAICFTYPGIIGSMDFTPARALYRTSPLFRRTMDHCNSIWMSQICSTMNLIEILEKEWKAEEPKPYPWFSCVMAIQYSLTTLWISWGIQPDAVMGQCMGEVTAAVVCGVISLEDAFRILKISDYLLEDNQIMPGAMMAMKCYGEICEQLITEIQYNVPGAWIDLAGVNSPSQTVMAASPGTIKILGDMCKSRGIKCRQLPIDFAVHSKFAQNACLKAKNTIFCHIQHNPCTIPYISSISGKMVQGHEFSPNYWHSLFREPVQFTKACSSASNFGCDVYLEIGLGTALTALISDNLGSKTLCLPSLQKIMLTDDCWHSLLNSLSRLYVSGVIVDWDGFYRSLPRRNKIDLPHYPFQRKSFWFKRRNKLNPPLESHPLAGSIIPNCTNKTIFNSRIDISNHLYIYDHLIGEHVIFPAAGFMEMMVAAVETKQCDSNKSLTLNDFKVHSPLHLHEDGVSVQTLLWTEKTLNSEYYIAHIYSADSTSHSDDHKWTLHASAKVVGSENNAIEAKSAVPLEDEISSSFDLQAFYDNLATVGLKYGSKFQSLSSSVYRNDSGTFMLVQVPEDSDRYFCHPILIDAMIQCFIALTKPTLNKLHVPVQIERFTVNKNPRNTVRTGSSVFVSCKTPSSGLTNTVNMLTTDGFVIATMRNISFAVTSVESMLSAAGLAKVNHGNLTSQLSPIIYDISWQPSKFPYVSRNTTHAKDKSWVLLHDGVSTTLNALMEKMYQSGRNVLPISIQSIYDKNISVQGILEQYLNTDLEGILYCIINNEIESYPTSQKTMEPLLMLSKCLMSTRQLPKLHLVTNGCWKPNQEGSYYSREGTRTQPRLSALLWGFMRNLRMELPGIISKSIDIDITEGDDTTWSDYLIREMWMDDKETEICFRNGQRLCRRLKPVEEKELHPHKIIPVTRENPQYTVEFPKSKIISDIKYIPKEICDLREGEVEIEVRYCSLNFKDVLTIIASNGVFENMEMLGLDYAGVITKVGDATSRWKIGDAVFGCNFREKIVTSHTRLKQDLLMKIPQKLTLSEAATLPTVFITAWYCMVKVASLKAGQTILIHAASGGVGLIATQIANMLGVNVIATAGSEGKRKYLKLLGIEHVFNSRSVDFLDNVRDALRGISQPVDMVLNCLTGPGFKEASLDLVRDGGYFVEISKSDIWTEEEVKQFRPLVHYHIVNAMEFNTFMYQELMQTLVELIGTGHMKPLPCSIYPAEEIVSALKFLQRAKHIGKVVLDMPVQPIRSLILKYHLFNNRSTYFISGGMGAIGWGIAKWMISQGAKYLVLAGRSKSTINIKCAIDKLEKDTGCKVIYKQVDISNYGECKKLLESIQQEKNLPPLKGIHHCAGVLSDSLITKENWSNFEMVLRPKVQGAWNLHSIIAEMDLPLDFFVLFSSMSCTFGNIGQSNYVAGNTYMDSLAEVRRRMGLTAMSVNWGQWNAGMAENRHLDAFVPFSLDQGIQVLEQLMTTERNTNGKSIVVAGIFNAREILKKAPYFETTLLEHVLPSSELMLSPVQQDIPDDGNTKLKVAYWKTISAERPTLVRKCVLGILCETLGISTNEVNENVALTDMGMDSLMSIEFANKLLSQVEDNVAGFIDIEEHGTVSSICQLLISNLESSGYKSS